MANDGSKTFLMSAMCGYGFVALRNAISAVGRSREIAEDRTIRMAPGDTSVGSTHRSSDEKTKNEPYGDLRLERRAPAFAFLS